jgi:hypothetical protein
VQAKLLPFLPQPKSDRQRFARQVQQGDQFRRIFAYLAVAFFWQFFENY